MKANLDIHHKQMQEVYHASGLKCLSNDGYTYKGVNILVNPDSGFEHPLWNSYKNLRDILNCSQDLMYFTGNLFLYAPYINNPLNDVTTEPFGYPVSHYHQNWYDHRFCTFISCCFEKAYNYWDRIGDLLYSFYPTLLPNIRSVDFTRIVDAIHKLGETDDDFVWLYEFRISHYEELNKFRKDVVHYYQYETTFHFEHTINCTDLERIAVIWGEKQGFPEYFKSQLELGCDGCLSAYAYLRKVKEFRNNNPGAAIGPLKPAGI